MIRFPAEWEPQKRVWLAWPHNAVNWGERPLIFAFYETLIGIIRRFQPVALIVPPDTALSFPSASDDRSRHPIECIPMPTDDIWIRDYGPIFVDDAGKKAVAAFRFNAWGAKFPPWDRDDRVPLQIARKYGIPMAAHDVVFEGGAIDVNGRGVGITTLPCLVGPNRQPPMSRQTVEETLRSALGLTSMLVLPEGLCGDHTDGHVDNVARFLSEDHVVVAREDDTNADNHPILVKAKKAIEAFRPGGRTLKVSELPLPPTRAVGDEILPASYMNFIFVNGGLIVPTYGTPLDDVALDFFRSVFPEREVVGIDCTLVIEEGGSLHCLSKQEPLLPGEHP